MAVAVRAAVFSLLPAQISIPGFPIKFEIDILIPELEWMAISRQAMVRELLLSLAFALNLHQTAGAGSLEISFSCRPALSVFCENIHVSCAGRTNIKTSPFKASIIGAIAKVDFESAERPRKGHVSGSNDLVIRLENSRDWIRIQEDGRYSHRIYRARGTAMSHGFCRRTATH